MDNIKFGKRVQPFFELSPYHYRGIRIDNMTWRTLIHYWCGCYFKEPYMKEYICTTNNIPTILKECSLKGMDDFDKIEPNKIIFGITEKFRQHKDLKSILLTTGSVDLIYDGVGFLAENNRYGRILMNLRRRYDIEQT